MDSRSGQRLSRYQYQPAAIALAYRWATLVVGLLIALFATSPLGSERAALLAPIAMAAVVSGLAVRSPPARWLPVALGAEMAVAAVAIWVTGYSDSPLLLYLTAPVIHAAIMRDPWLVAALWVLAVGLFMGVVAIDPVAFAFQPGSTIRDIALLVILPVLVLALRAAADARSTRRNILINDEDLVIASELSRHHTYKQIGDVLDMSPETVKVHVARLYRRLGANSRDEALGIIDDWGLLREDARQVG